MVRYKGRDQIEYGHYPYTETNYGQEATSVTLYRIGYLTEIKPSYDPELNRQFVLRDSDEGKPLGIYSRKTNIRLTLSWLQGELTDYYQKYLLGGYNTYAEAKQYHSATAKIYHKWTGLKLDTLTIRCSIGEPITWTAELIAQTTDTMNSTTNTYGASPGAVWEWDDAYLQLSTNGTDWTTIPDVTDWELRIENNLKPNHTFNPSGEKTLQSLEEMEQHCNARFTMYLPSDTYLAYLHDQTKLYLKLVLPCSQYIQFSEGKLSLYDPVLRPEDLVSCRVEYMGGYLEHSFT